MSLIARQIEVIPLPITSGLEILHPEHTILAFGDGSLDLGAFCYTKFSPPLLNRSGAERPKSERLVDPETLVPSRVIAMRRVITYLSDLFTSAGLRSKTVYSYARYFVSFLDWAERTGYSNVLHLSGEARLAFRAYVEYLRHLVDTGQVKTNSVAMKQNKVLQILSDLTGLDDLHHGVNLLQCRKSSVSSTEPASEDAQAHVLALCQCLFDGLSDFCLEFKPYPFGLEVPPTLKEDANRLWIFPGSKWCMPEHELADRSRQAIPHWAHDYREGRLATVDEIKHRYSCLPSKNTPEKIAELAIVIAEEKIQSANKNPHHRSRVAAAMIAHNAFVILFLANTGMNLSSLQELPWTDKHEVGTERQGFRAVKYRAGGRVVSFEIQVNLLPAFRKFLRLREYLLNGSSFSRLFVSRGQARAEFRPLSDKAITNIIGNLQRLDPQLPDIQSRKWRACKSDWLLRNTDVATAAIVLQNSEASVLASYAAGSSTVHREEMGVFFDRLGVVLECGVDVNQGVPNAVGLCMSFGSPKQVATAPVVSDCKAPEGCLFCDKYKIHADETDVRKLLSCRYCIQRTAHLAASEEHFQELFAPVILRINSILQAVDSRSPGLVARIDQEVERGELDTYWASKFEMLLDLGLVE